MGAGAKACATAKELGGLCDVVFTCLQTSDQVETVIFGRDGLASGPQSGRAYRRSNDGRRSRDATDCDTIGKTSILELIDAPVSGGPQYAAAGTDCHHGRRYAGTI